METGILGKAACFFVPRRHGTRCPALKTAGKVLSFAAPKPLIHNTNTVRCPVVVQLLSSCCPVIDWTTTGQQLDNDWTTNGTTGQRTVLVPSCYGEKPMRSAAVGIRKTRALAGGCACADVGVSYCFLPARSPQAAIMSSPREARMVQVTPWALR